MDQAAILYKEQLPTQFSTTLPMYFNYFAGLASILGLLYTVFAPPDKIFLEPQTIHLLHTGFLITLTISLLAHAYLRDRRKLSRYAQACIANTILLSV